ncbi:MAG: hypothetical protein C0417_13475 [Chlorobiaceae bacterium]|nr:hypothetical protein [Chlorobiaceae bacterium]
MLWINFIFLILIVIGQAQFRGCDWIQQPIDIPSSPGERIYFNSFETSADTIGWNGWMEFRREAPPIGGQQSVYISGGCIYPHAYINLPAENYDRLLILRCWGKNLEIGGLVELRLNPEVSIWPSPHVSISVNDTLWKFYQSDTLHCPANIPLQLSMSAGGIVPSTMLVDLIEIIRVK